MLSDFRFANPQWSAALWLVAVAVALLLWLDQRRGNVLSRMLSPAMQARLVRRSSLLRRWTSIVCLGLAGIGVVVALMRPQWGLRYVETPRVGAQVMVCLDVSKSMLAEDTAPNRLERAKAELADLLTYLDGDQVGLIAFAGRASVLCPLTPDFGFFKLILDGASPNSVGRGGTRLEEPIRKAIEGFRSESDVSRLLVLITDGEDHDSHPIDAAKAAAERGIKILAIGIGDEAGSEIRITDPKTGVQHTVRDINGDVVRTRLDGQTLRDMALATQGAYIPAGTGVLNLQSIYDAHIAPLVRGQLDDRGRAVRNEAFQWPLLAAVLFLVSGIVLASGSRSQTDDLNFRSAPAVGKSVAAIAILTATLGLPQSFASADDADSSATDTVVTDSIQAPAVAATSKTSGSAKTKPTENDPDADLENRDPRSLYNDALSEINSDFDAAERLLVAARRNAGIDGELRFRATYNMGWVEVGRADELLKEKPAESLRHLESAADWFRMAIGLRDDDLQARHNLEVVLRRILELRDSLEKQDDRDVTQRLDALIEAQRAVVGSALALVQRVSAVDDPNATDAFRNEFRQLAVEQRKQLADAQSLTEVAREELDSIDGKPEADRTDEQNLRAAQLSNVLHYINRANQRMGGARSQMRLRQPERAFRRAATALEELKRARDQLRDPVEVLDQILSDAAAATQATAAVVANESASAESADKSNAVPSLPAWLNQDYVRERQQSVSERTTELHERLKAGVAEHDAQSPDPTEAGSDEAEAFAESLRQALPALDAGDKAMRQAVEQLNIPNYADAFDQQREGIKQLQDAREQFLDLRGLIELTYATQSQIAAALDDGPVADQATEESSEETAPPLTKTQIADRQALVSPLQTRNRTRLDRLAKLIDKQREAAAAAAAAKSEAEPAPVVPADEGAADPAAEMQRLDLATELTTKAKAEMTSVLETLALATVANPKPENDEAAKEKPSEAKEKPSDAEVKADEKPADDKPVADEKPSDEKSADKPVADEKPADEKPTADEEVPPAVSEENPFALPSGHAQAAVEHLKALRRLFFSVVEHLREAAMRQAQLNDETQQVAGLQDDPAATRQLGPISLSQAELSNKAQRIAEALAKQAAESPESAAGHQMSPQQTEQLEQTGQRYREAADLVTAGMQSMQKVGDALTTETPQIDSAREHQDAALAKLVEALQLLQPPEQDQNNQSQGDGENQSQPSKPEPDQEEQQQRNSSRFLQAVRDREAQRRRDQERRQQMTNEPVAKDW